MKRLFSLKRKKGSFRLKNLIRPLKKRISKHKPLETIDEMDFNALGELENSKSWLEEGREMEEAAWNSLMTSEELFKELDSKFSQLAEAYTDAKNRLLNTETSLRHVIASADNMPKVSIVAELTLLLKSNFGKCSAEKNHQEKRTEQEQSESSSSKVISQKSTDREKKKTVGTLKLPSVRSDLDFSNKSRRSEADLAIEDIVPSQARSQAPIEPHEMASVSDLQLEESPGRGGRRKTLIRILGNLGHSPSSQANLQQSQAKSGERSPNAHPVLVDCSIMEPARLQGESDPPSLQRTENLVKGQISRFKLDLGRLQRGQQPSDRELSQNQNHLQKMKSATQKDNHFLSQGVKRIASKKSAARRPYQDTEDTPTNLLFSQREDTSRNLIKADTESTPKALTSLKKLSSNFFSKLTNSHLTSKAPPPKLDALSERRHLIILKAGDKFTPENL